MKLEKKDSVSGNMSNKKTGSITVRDSQYPNTLLQRTSCIRSTALASVRKYFHVLGKEEVPHQTIVTMSKSEQDQWGANYIFSNKAPSGIRKIPQRKEPVGVIEITRGTSYLAQDYNKSFIEDVLNYCHEYSHLIFDKYLKDHTETDYNNAYMAFSEGWAIMMSFIIATRISNDPDFNDSTRAYAREYKKKYIRVLRDGVLSQEVISEDQAHHKIIHHNMAYIEGVFKIFHYVFKNYTESEIQDILFRLDPKKLVNTARDSEEYQILIQLGKPNEILDYFSKNAAES